MPKSSKYVNSVLRVVQIYISQFSSVKGGGAIGMKYQNAKWGSDNKLGTFRELERRMFIPMNKGRTCSTRMLHEMQDPL
ncbi:hypothetical protein CJU74_17435 [Pseudomonas fragi]|nr:hypothetical protein CJU74_17435 [Pseudomonas fragi]